MKELINQVRYFKQWASEYAPNERYGEWEVDYPEWIHLYKAISEFVASYSSISEWSAEQLQLVLYILARDNECQNIAKELSKSYPETLIQLARVSIELGEPDAKWQLAKELSQIQSEKAKIEEILVALAHDSDEYVRRQALISLARIKSKFTENLALKIWYQSHENQQWSRMAVLWCLNRIDSSHFDPLRLEAELDSRPYLSEYAKKARQKDFNL